MRDLTAQVTSSLLHFPEKTLRALGEDDITPGSVLYGKFSGGRNDLAWLARGPRLEVVNSVTGEWLSAWRFTGTHKEPPTIRVVKEFSWKSKTGLLVGLEEAKGSVLCLYDLGIARVVKAVVLPGKVVAVEPIANCGGPSVYTQHLHQSMRWLFGVVAVATDIGHLFLLDLCLDYFSWIPNEIKALDLKFATTFPEEVAQRRETTTREGRHLCFQLEDPSGTAISMLHYISRSNHLVVGFSDGCLSLWNMETLKREHHYQLEGERIPVCAVTFQEPENDPKNCCYLWAVQSTQESGRGVLSLHLVQLTFSRQNHLASGQVMYEGLECCQERFSLDLADGILPLRGQTSHMKLLSCQTIEDFEGDVGREDSAQKVTSPHTSVSVFTWQVNTCGQEKPSTYLGVFDINNWYDAQMPDSLRPEEFLPSCPYFALWSLDKVTSMATPNPILDILVHQPSLTWEAPPSYLPPEQIFNASGYNFDAVCLLSSGVVHISFTGFQKEEEQLEAMVSVAAETGSFKLLTGCMKHWISERTPDSAANLQFIRDCAWNKVVYTKDEFDRVCAPLFDGSCKFIDPQMLQSLREDHSLLSNLSTVLHCFQREQQELPEEGFADLANKQLLASNYSLYAKVVTWFCKFILPVVSDETMHSSTHFYNYPLLQTFYTDRRQKLSRGNQHSDCLKIDELVYQSGDHVTKLWQRDGGTGQYPPPNLHALLDVYLLESVDEIYKHGITIYFLEDIFHSLPTKPEFLVQWFATAFAVPRNIFLLIQQFWIMDHGDYKRDGSTCSTEGAATTYSMLDYSGKILPRQQRKLTAQRAKPYSWLLSLLREGRNTCLTLIRQAKGRNVCTGATTSTNILSRLQKHIRKTSRPSGSHSAPEKHPYKKSNRTTNHKMSSP